MTEVERRPRLRTQKLAMPDGVRVEIGFDLTLPLPEGVDLAVLAYDDPMEALRDACAFVETALAAVREAGPLHLTDAEYDESDGHA